MTKKDGRGLLALRRVYLLLMLAGIFYVSHQPSLGIIPPLFPMQDKVIHAVEFFLLFSALLLNRDLCRGFHPMPVLVVFAGIYAVLDEVHQSYIPGRDCSIGDVVADFTGIGFCLLTYICFSNKRKDSA